MKYVIKLKIESDIFEINDLFDWNLSEMKNLFLHIKNAKNEKLSSDEKNIIAYIEKREKKEPFKSQTAKFFSRKIWK